MSQADLIILKETVVGPTTLVCPLCVTDRFAIEVPPIQQPPDALGEIFGMSGSTLGRVFADQEVGRAAHEMRVHLRRHTPEEWLTWGSDR